MASSPELSRGSGLPLHLHTTLCVRDLDRARDFYSGLLGLAEIADRPLSFPGLWYDLGANAQLHLILDPAFKGAIANSDKWGRAPHLALHVPELDSIRQRLDERDIAYQSSASGRPAVFLRDPDGNTIELCAVRPPAPQPTPQRTDGLFVVFEGVEGSGKTTQIDRLEVWLRENQAAPVVRTREPGGTELGTQIRALLLDAKTREPIADRAELLLFAADRAQHVESFIRPQLEAGAIVLCDRFTASTIAYQGYARGLDLATISQLNAIATAGLAPDLTVWLDLDPAVGLERARDRGEVNRLDRESLAFHQRVYQGYSAVAAGIERDGRLCRIDASADVETVAATVRSAIGAAIEARSARSEIGVS
ncbi:MAG: dTMP kinase [Geitlerinemataceae cyanobacterium]